MARSFAAHSSPIVSCLLSKYETFLFSTALNEQCILQWDVLYEDKNWEYDMKNEFLATSSSDPFREVPTPDIIQKLVRDVWTPRAEIKEVALEGFDLKLEAIGSRRAHDRRNNLAYDSQEQILFSSGTHICSLARMEDGSEVVQFLHQNAHVPVKSPAEVSCFSLSSDRRVICYGTAELECRVLLWDLCAFVQLYEVQLPNCHEVHVCRLSADSRFLLAVALTRDYRQKLILVEMMQRGEHKIVASADLSRLCAFKVK